MIPCPNCGSRVPHPKTTWQQQRRALGRCVQCGTPHTAGTWRCLSCRLKVSVTGRRWWARQTQAYKAAREARSRKQRKRTKVA